MHAISFHVKPKLIKIASLRLIISIVLILVAGCAQQSSQSHSDPPKSVSAGTDGTWYLLLPPQRSYNSDVPPSMGGPLANPPLNGTQLHGAYALYSLDQFDLKAPLNRWKKAGAFGSGQECESAKAKQLKEISDPVYMARVAQTQRNRLVDPSFLHALFEDARCASADQIP